MSSPPQRAQPRVKYPAQVRLFAGPRSTPLVGQARDLGPAGIFVESGERLAIGTPVVCELNLPSGPVRLPGLVAREQALAPPPDPRDTVPERVLDRSHDRNERRVGLGIRFVDLDEAARRQIEGLIPPGERAGQLVAIHLDGLREALRSQAAFGADHFKVTTTLPFLRNGGDVRVAFLSGTTRIESRGVVRDVGLAGPGPDGSPRLELQLQLVPPAEMTSHEPSARAAAAGAPVDDPDESEEVTEVTAVETPVGRASGITSGTLGMPTTAEILERDRALTTGLRRIQRSGRLRRGPRVRLGNAVAPGAPAVRWAALIAGGLFLMATGAALNRYGLERHVRAPKPANDDTGPRAEVFAGRAERPAPLPTALATAPVPSAAPPASPPATSPGSSPASAAGSTRGSAPTSATAPAPGSAPASVPSAPIAAERAPSDDQYPALAAAPQPAAAPAAAERPRVQDVLPPARPASPAATEAAPPDEAAATREAATAVGITTLPPGTPGPQVETGPDEVVAVVPIDGSTAGAVHYPLTQPRGIAVDLPQARATLPLGRHAVFNDGFRFISIRAREGGGLRIAFTYAYYTPRLVDVNIESQAVRVRVAPLRSGARTAQP